MEQFHFIISEELEDERLDKAVTELSEGAVSRSFLQKRIREQQVFVNHRPEKASYRLKCGDAVNFDIPDRTVPEILPENIPLDILYEDDDVIVVNKPKGMVVHPAAGHYSGTLVNALLYHCNGQLSDLNGMMRPGIVHRIDKDTTGSVIACKNNDAHQNIAGQLKNHSVVRKYRAVCCGVLKDDEGTVSGLIGRDEKDRKKMSVHVKNGKPAVTHYRVLQRFKDCTYIECQLETGRTHQIRVHMASIGHPLLGDSVYAHRKWKYETGGQVLHAYLLGFQHPVSGAYIETEAPLPDYFEKLLTVL